MVKRQSSTIERLRIQVQRTDARQRLLGQRLNRAFDDHQAARTEYEDAVVEYIAVLEEAEGQHDRSS